MKARDWNPAEAVGAFVAWLTTRPGTLVLGSSHDAAVAFQLVQEFCDRHQLPDLRRGWQEAIVRPPPPDAHLGADRE